MPRKVVKTIHITLHGVGFDILIYSDYEVSLKRTTLSLDNMREPVDEYNRFPTDPKVAIAVYKAVVGEVSNWVHESKPPMVKWSAGLDKSRISLYKRLGRKIESLGYKMEHNPSNPNFFIAYRIM